MTTLGWPNEQRMKERGFDTFYPTSVLVTGFDIIFFWVARMMMMGEKFTSKVPFHKTYIHAIVRDKQGRKMSKSLGNGIDPIEMVETYGADAFRFTLAAGSGYNRGLNLDSERIGGYRNFINKIWNAYRFIQPYLELAGNELPKDLDQQEKWILSELNNTSKIMNESIEDFRFDDSCQALYAFIYDSFCSWFIELSKNTLNGDNTEEKQRRATVLKYCFRNIVALLHPFSPFITEELWSDLKSEDESLLIQQEYPEYSEDMNFAKEQDNMNKLIEIVSNTRFLRQSVNIKPKEEVNIKLFTDENDLTRFLNDNLAGIKDLAKANDVQILSKESARPDKSIMKATTHTEIFLPLEGVIDLTQQVSRLEKDLLKATKEYEKYEKKINNEKFIANAKPEVVQEVKEKASELKEQIDSIKDRINTFKN